MSLEKKLDIITQIRQGRSQRAVADGFGVAKSTVGDIWKNREKIEIHVSASTNPAFAKKRCIVRDAHFHKLDEACYIWFQQQRAKGAPVSGPLLQEKALQLFPSLYPDGDPGYQLLTDNEIVAQVSGEADLSASESEDEPDPGPTVSHAQAHEAFGIALQWLEAKGTYPAHLLLVQNWMTVAGRKRNDSLTQTEITSFFRPHTSSM